MSLIKREITAIRREYRKHNLWLGSANWFGGGGKLTVTCSNVICILTRIYHNM